MKFIIINFEIVHFNLYSWYAQIEQYKNVVDPNTRDPRKETI